MGILFSNEILPELIKELNNAKENVSVISAFCKIDILKFFDQHIYLPNIEKKIIVRFSMADVMSKITDFDIYTYCKEHAWELFIDLNLHAKTYVFDNKRGVIGSANATNKGFGTVSNSNHEISSLITFQPSDMVKINRLFESSTPMTDIIYDQMKQELEKVDITKAKTLAGWSQKLRDMIVPQITSIFAFELPSSSFADRDYSFLDIGMMDCDNKDLFLKEAFCRSKAFRWLIKALKENKEHTLYFGALSTQLHNDIVQDPKPYRKDVKQYLINLLTWVEALADDIITIDRPNYSQRVRLK